MTIGPEGDALLRELGEALRESVDADDVARVGRDVWAWRDPDAGLAELVADSLSDAPAAGVRGPGALRVLRFESGALSIEVELAEGRLRGLALSPQAATMELHTPDGLAVSTAVEATGWFEIELPGELRGGAALLRLRLLDDAGEQTWTAWFRS